MKTEFRPRRDIDVVVFITNDMYGNEWTEESESRWETFTKLWNDYGPFYWIASAGLTNNQGITIAQSIINRFGSYSKLKYLIGRDDKSADTYSQLLEIDNIFRKFLDQRIIDGIAEPKLFLISDSFHLWSIQRITKNIGFKVNSIASKLSGNFSYKTKRLLTELFRLLVSIMDPHFQSSKIKAMREKRIIEAREKP